MLQLNPGSLFLLRRSLIGLVMLGKVKTIQIEAFLDMREIRLEVSANQLHCKVIEVSLS